MLSGADLEDFVNKILSEGKTSDFLSLLLSKAAPATTLSDEIEGPLKFRPMVFNGIGSKVRGHFHKYDHHTYIRKGSVLCRFHPCDENGNQIGETSEKVFSSRDKTHRILILANTWHEFTALEENTEAECTFPHRDYNGNISLKYIGNDGAYV